MNRAQLFCLPYAGGSAMIYNGWAKYLEPAVALFPVELAGRGKRITDPLYLSTEDMVEDAYEYIRGQLNGLPYALFGHSMGALIVYEVVRRIKAERLPYPAHVFFSGRNAPQVTGENKKYYSLMSDEEFQKEVLELGGTSPEFFSHPELVQVFLPMLRNDFRLAETEPPLAPIDSDITVFLGKEETLTSVQCHAWKNHSSGTCTICYLPGGHFFIHHQTRRIVGHIRSVLSPFL